MPRKQRATAIIEYEHKGERGILVHADRDGFWLLPGGGIEHRELPLVAAVRELREETGLEATAAAFLFAHQGKFNDHMVYLVQAQGKPAIVDAREAPAFGLCREDMTVLPFLVQPGFSPSGAKLMASNKKIIERYGDLLAERPTLSDALAPARVTGVEAASDDSDSTPAEETCQPPAASIVSLPILTQRSGLLRVQVGASVLELAHGDIVRQDVAAIVNAANERLANGGGVCGAIHRAAGAAQLEAACREIGRCPTGAARITPGFKLAPQQIIHAVGPRYSAHTPAEADRLLASAYRASLELARKDGLDSVAFPSLSTGIFGFPVDQAARVALQAIVENLTAHPERILVRLVLLNDTRPAFERELLALAHP